MGDSHSVVSNSFATPWTVACQAPLSMGFSRQEYWSGLQLAYKGLRKPGCGQREYEAKKAFFLRWELVKQAYELMGMLQQRREGSWQPGGGEFRWVRRGVFWCSGDRAEALYPKRCGSGDGGRGRSSRVCGVGAAGGVGVSIYCICFLMEIGSTCGMSWEKRWEKAWGCEEEGEGVMSSRQGLWGLEGMGP